MWDGHMKSWPRSWPKLRPAWTQDHCQPSQSRTIVWKPSLPDTFWLRGCWKHYLPHHLPTNSVFSSRNENFAKHWSITFGKAGFLSALSNSKSFPNGTFLAQLWSCRLTLPAQRWNHDNKVASGTSGCSFYPGRDGWMRVVSVKMTKGAYKRPSTKVAPTCILQAESWTVGHRLLYIFLFKPVWPSPAVYLVLSPLCI